MPRRKITKNTSGVSRKKRVDVPAASASTPEEASPVTLRSPVFHDAFEDVEEALSAIDEAALRGPRRTSLATPRRDVG